jgi:patatin-like phospholipase/acyl hydrolase
MPDAIQTESTGAYSKLRILSIDGGGIRGVIPATILTHIEKQIIKLTGNKDAKLGEYFDLIAGTSTGGILATLYLTPAKKDKTRAKYSAEDALSLYASNGNKIFKRGFWDNITNFKLWNEKFRADNLQKLLHEYFGETLLSELIRPCVITSYDFLNRRATFFNSFDARIEGAAKDFLVKNITRATSAAPTYFEPTQIKSTAGADFNLIDGGVFVNNPAMCAYSEARNTDFTRDPFMQTGFKLPKPDKPTAKDMFHLSIGTGSDLKHFTFDKLHNAGLITWVPVLIDIMMSGNSETVDYHLRKIYETLQLPDKEDYFRLAPHLHEASSEMDNATAKNITKLKEAGELFISTNLEKLNKIAEKLVEYS